MRKISKNTYIIYLYIIKLTTKSAFNLPTYDVTTNINKNSFFYMLVSFISIVPQLMSVKNLQSKHDKLNNVFRLLFLFLVKILAESCKRFN